MPANGRSSQDSLTDAKAVSKDSMELVVVVVDARDADVDTATRDAAGKTLVATIDSVSMDLTELMVVDLDDIDADAIGETEAITATDGTLATVSMDETLVMIAGSVGMDAAAIDATGETKATAATDGTVAVAMVSTGGMILANEKAVTRDMGLLPDGRRETVDKPKVMVKRVLKNIMFES